MHVMRLERMRSRNRAPAWIVGGGCLILGSFTLVLLCAGLYTFGVLTPLVLQIAGIERIGQTDALFGDAQPQAVPQVQAASNPARFTLSLGNYGQETLATDPRTYTVSVGSSAAGLPIATARFSESGLLQLCQQRSTLCSAGDDLLRNGSVDLRPGGAVIYADLNVQGSGYWQRVGVVLRLDASEVRFVVAGVDVDGVLYNPTSAPFGIADSIAEIERTGNDLLRQVALQTGGQNYTLERVILDETALTLVLR